MICPFAKPIVKLAAGGIFALTTVLCSTAAMAAEGGGGEEPKVLNIYNWSDYIGEDTIPNFEKEFGIKVRYDVFDSNEILHAKLVAGRTGYDVVVPSSNWAKIQIAGGLLKKLDKSKIPNWKNLDPKIMAQLSKVDPGNEHLVDWMWGFTTVGVNLDKVKAALGDLPWPQNDWSLIFDPKYISKLKSCGVSMLDSSEDVVDAALLYLGKTPYSKDPADYQDVAKLLASIRPYITVFSSSGYINDFANGSLCVGLGWSGDFGIARQRAIEAKNGNHIDVRIPSGGALLFFDTMAIPVDAPHPNNAHLWINYILRPEVDAGLTNKVFYSNPNQYSKQYVKASIAADETIYLPADKMKTMIPPETVNNDIRRILNRVYTQFKTGV